MGLSRAAGLRGWRAHGDSPDVSDKVASCGGGRDRGQILRRNSGNPSDGLPAFRQLRSERKRKICGMS
ncbi:MAG: hypothetical protein ACKPJD_20415, partial [Planctomycetaceae bacterium]